MTSKMHPINRKYSTFNKQCSMRRKIKVCKSDAPLWDGWADEGPGGYLSKFPIWHWDSVEGTNTLCSAPFPHLAVIGAETLCTTLTLWSQEALAKSFFIVLLSCLLLCPSWDSGKRKGPTKGPKRRVSPEPFLLFALDEKEPFFGISAGEGESQVAELMLLPH